MSVENRLRNKDALSFVSDGLSDPPLPRILSFCSFLPDQRKAEPSSLAFRFGCADETLCSHQIRRGFADCRPVLTCSSGTTEALFTRNEGLHVAGELALYMAITAFAIVG